jgi:pyruvate dehydrogenase E1 component beta subunit
MNPDIFLMGECLVGGAGLPEFENDDVTGGAFGATRGLVREFTRKRVMDTPISESAIVGATLGASLAGLRPVTELMFAGFFGCAGDQIFNQVAKIRYMTGGQAKPHLVIRAAYGAGWSGAAQHSDAVYSMITHIPGLKVVVPSVPYDAKGLLTSAMRDDDPVFCFEAVPLYDSRGEVPEDQYAIPIGKADVKREGSGVTIIAIGQMVGRALKAAESISKDGIDAEVLDPRSLSPLDEKAIVDSVQKTRRLVIADEDQPRCSISTDIAALVSEKCFDYLEQPIRRVNAPHGHVPHSPVMENYYLPSPERIIEAVRSVAS